VAEHPQVPQYREELATTHNNLGGLLLVTRRLAEAEKAYRQALELYERLVAEHPQVADYNVELARTLAVVGVLSSNQGKTEEAQWHLERARKILREVADKHRELVEAQRLLKGVDQCLEAVRQLRLLEEKNRNPKDK